MSSSFGNTGFFNTSLIFQIRLQLQNEKKTGLPDVGFYFNDVSAMTEGLVMKYAAFSLGP